MFDTIKIDNLQQYHIMVDIKKKKKIREVYDYEWTDAKI
mgnify:CR=1 FL=1